MENAIFKYSEFFKNDGGFEIVRAEFKKLGDDLIQKAKEVREKTKLIDINNIQQINNLEKETAELIQMNKNYSESLKKIDALELKLATTRKKNTTAISKETEAIRKQRVEKRAIAKIQNTQIGTIENLRAKLSLVTIAWTKLTAKEIENTSRGKRLNESKKQLTATLKQLERATNDNRRNVGNYSSALGKARGSLVSLTSAMGVSLGLFGAFRVIKSSVAVVRDYEKANATLAGVLGVTKDQTEALRIQSQQLGQTTVRTAQDVATLQTAYARLGFTQAEILELTAPTIDGSIALNASLEDTSMLVGAIVNSYDGLSATDAPKILETLSAGTTKSALTFEKLSTALPIVLGGANALDIGLEEVTATLGKLSDAGIDTSTGATSLRNIFIESAKRGINYKDALDQISKSQDKLTTANKIFGKRSAISALVIANNTSGVSELTKELDNASVVANLVDNELNTLDGSLKLLVSAWEGLVLKMNEGSGAGKTLTSTIRFLAENMETILKVLGIATTTWISYNLVMKASNALTKANIVWTKGASIAQNINTIATRVATTAQKAFNLALKSNPLGLVVALLATAVASYIAFSDSVSDAVKQQERLNNVLEDGKVISEKRIKEGLSGEKKAVDERIKLIEDEIKQRRAQGENGDALDRELLKRKNEIYNDEVASNQKQIDESQRALDVLIGLRQVAIDDVKAKNYISQAERDAELVDIEKTYGLAIQETRIGLEARNKEIARLGKEMIETNKNVDIEDAKAKLKRQKELALLRRRLKDLQNESIGDDEAKEIAIAETKFKREIKAIKGNSQIEKDLRKQLEETMNSEIAEIKGKYKLKREKDYRDAEIFETLLIKDSTERQIAQEKERSAKVLEQIKNSISLTESERAKFTKEENQKSADAITKIQIDAELNRLDKIKEIETAKIDQRKSEFETEKEFEAFKEKELNRIMLENLKARLETLQKFNGDAFDVEIEQIKAQIAGLETVFGKDTTSQLGKEIEKTFNQVFDAITVRQQQAVEDSKKMLEEQTANVEEQRARAEAGLTNTLAFEQRELGKREAEIIKRQKREDRLKKIQALYSSYNNYSNQGDKNPITKALKDFAIMEAITASFRDGGITGIDGVKTNQFGVTTGKSHNANGTGGNLAWHESGEGFFSRKDIKGIGGQENFYKMKDLASSGKLDSNFFSKQKEMFVQGVPVSVPNKEVVTELKSVKQAIENKPVSSFDVNKLTEGILNIVETVKTKNHTKRNHFITKKPRL